MKCFWIFLVLVQLLSIRVCNGYPSGAPSSACASLTPGHGVQLTGVNPFMLTVEQNTSNRLLVTLTSTSGNSSFQGFILQAREVSTGPPVGSFGNLPVGTKAIACSQNMDTTTHTDTTSKTTLNFQWTPGSVSTTVRFYVTVAVTKGSYWKGIQSDEVSLPLNAEMVSSTGSVQTTVHSSSPSKASVSAPSAFMLLLGHFVLVLSVLY